MKQANGSEMGAGRYAGDEDSRVFVNSRDFVKSEALANEYEIDLLDDSAGPEFLTEQDVRTLLGIPRSDRWGFDSEGGF